jgi:gamma-glutamyltranspeptidase
MENQKLEFKFEELDLEGVLEKVEITENHFRERWDYLNELMRPMYADLANYIDDPVFKFFDIENNKMFDEYMKFSDVRSRLRKLIRIGRRQKYIPEITDNRAHIQ